MRDKRWTVRITYDNPAERNWTEEENVWAPDAMTAIARAQAKHKGYARTIDRATAEPFEP